MYATQTLWLTRVHRNNLRRHTGSSQTILSTNSYDCLLQLQAARESAAVACAIFGGICSIVSAFRIRSYESNALVQMLGSCGHSCLDGRRQGATSEKVRCLALVLPAFESHNTGTCCVLLHTRMFPTPPRWSSIRRSRIG